MEAWNNAFRSPIPSQDSYTRMRLARAYRARHGPQPAKAHVAYVLNEGRDSGQLRPITSSNLIPFMAVAMMEYVEILLNIKAETPPGRLVPLQPEEVEACIEYLEIVAGSPHDEAKKANDLRQQVLALRCVRIWI